MAEWGVTPDNQRRNYHIQDLNGLGDLQIDFKFEVLFNWNNAEAWQALQTHLGYDQVGELDSNLNILNPNGSLGNIESTFTAYARDIEFPGRQNGELTDEFQGWKTLYPGKMDFGNSITVDFAERQSGAILRTIQAWQEMINSTSPDNGRGSFQWTTDFKALCATLQVTMFTTDGRTGTYSGYFYNCWPTNRNPISLSMTSEDFVKPSIEFHFDWSEIRSYTARRSGSN